MSDLLHRLRLLRSLPAPEVARAIRLSAGVGVSAMARELDVSRMTIYRWESGERRPSGDRLERYLTLLEQIQDGAA